MGVRTLAAATPVHRIATRVAAVPLALFAVFGMFFVSLIMRYRPREKSTVLNIFSKQPSSNQSELLSAFALN
jgi:hypothetical protein